MLVDAADMVGHDIVLKERFSRKPEIILVETSMETCQTVIESGFKIY